MRERAVLISDPTLRDGNHATQHQLTSDSIIAYCRLANAAGIPIVEVGHGNGLGASSLQLGESAISDDEMLLTARAHLSTSLLGVHVIPGFATIKRDLHRAVDLGVDVFRVASHCTEADLTQRHIEFCRGAGKTAYGVLMMSHMTPPHNLVKEACKMESFGAQGVIIMDSAGYYLPEDVTERIRLLREGLGVPVGFHGHNNLGMAVANTLAAIEAGATIVDATARGLGAGAGNTQLEVLVAILERRRISTGIDLYKALDGGDLIQAIAKESIPSVSSESVVSGLAGVFSGFSKPIQRIAGSFGVDPRDVYRELGRRGIIAGQEDFIVEIAAQMSREKV